MRWLFTIIVVSSFVAITLTIIADEARPHTAGGGGTEGQDEFSWELDESYPDGSFNPTADQQQRLVVEWCKPVMGYFDYDEDGDSAWKVSESLAPNRMLAISGTLLIESADDKERRPIDWLQGVRVIVSRYPDREFDWSNRQEMHHAVWDDAVVHEQGKFRVYLSPGEVRRTVGKESSFQVALSLGEKTDKKITWKNTVPVLPQTVTMMKISGPPAVSETMQVINGAPSYHQNDFNPAKLIRAVNHLMLLGKEKAIQELRKFLEIARDDTYETIRIEDNIDTSDDTCVFLILQLLFEPADPKDELPQIMTAPFAPIVDEKDKKLWPLYPLYLQDDIPFFMVNSGGLGGVPDQPERHVDWAEEHGKIRLKPLRPIDNPMIAAQRIIALPQTKRLYEREIIVTDYSDLLFQQAWNITEDADPELPKPKPEPVANTWDERDWESRVRAASKFRINWDEKQQKYIRP